jgi:hypothetical protein
MVKKTLFFLSLTFTVFLFSGEFIANVSDAQVYLNQNFSLSLTLKDTSPKEAPIISSLNNHFLIHSQQQSSSTTIINGKVSSSITWNLSLTPKTEGLVEIPSITVNTEEGSLSTEPITLNVIKGLTSPSTIDSVGLNTITKVSNASPYKNEPFIYTAFLTSKMPLYNVQIQKIQLEDAIVELLEEPKLEEKVIGGVSFNVVEFSYLITPLKTGSIKIAPIAIQGAIPEKKKTQSSFPFNGNLDPFAIMQGFDRFKSFTLMTEEIDLNVQSPILEVSPWLPAKELTLEEVWPENQVIRVDEPFSRTFVIKGEGIKVSQLPHLEGLQNKSSIFNVYADKPEEVEKISKGIIQSTRKEHYTFIPQESGTWVLPEISITWWDTINKETKTSILPARKVAILPSFKTKAPNFPEIAPSSTPANLIEAPTYQISSFSSPFLYAIIGMLTFFLIAVIIWALILQRKITSLTKSPSQKPAKQPITPSKKSTSKFRQTLKKERLSDLNPT